MTSEAPANPLDGYITLRELAPRVGSYFSAYNLAATGALGPAVVVGRTRLYDRARAERALNERASRPRRGAAHARP